jgi:hypothetical protein
VSKEKILRERANYEQRALKHETVRKPQYTYDGELGTLSMEPAGIPHGDIIPEMLTGEGDIEAPDAGIGTNKDDIFRVTA